MKTGFAELDKNALVELTAFAKLRFDTQKHLDSAIRRHQLRSCFDALAPSHARNAQPGPGTGRIGGDCRAVNLVGGLSCGICCSSVG